MRKSTSHAHPSKCSGRASSRALLFAGRTVKEILRDPLSIILCLGVPLIMLVAMYALFASSAPWFSLDILAPGIAVFANAFVMLYMALLISRDRATAFLTRLYTSPMRTVDFVVGYALPGVWLGAAQLVICYLTAVVTGLVSGHTAWISVTGLLSAVVIALPVTVFYVCAGILCGCLFSDKAAPGLCSIVVSAGGFLSGAWMPVETLSEGFQTVCRALPFYPAVLAGRTVLVGAEITADSLWVPLITEFAYGLVTVVAAVLVFRFKTRREAE